MKIFYEQELDQYLESRKRALVGKIESEDSDYILNVDADKYVEYLVAEFSLADFVIDFDAIYVTREERMIRAELFPPDFNAFDGKSYSKQVITYHIPFRGEEEILRCQPNPHNLMTYEVLIEDNCICFDVIDFYGTADGIKKRADEIIRTIRTQYGHVKENLEAYEGELPVFARDALKNRQQKLQKQLGVISELGVPIKSTKNIPKTFAIPTVGKKVFQKPEVKTERLEPHPTISEEIYKEILQTIYDMGKVFERHPNTYRDKDEEALRDHLILQLEPRFEGSTTGETFNKSGKTDILIRYKNNNVFVAECKFWSGKKDHLKAIDQLLSYLTWRDSKTAIIYFVKNREISPVLDQIVESTSEHPNFIEGLGQYDKSWFNFKFHIQGDPGCYFSLAILVVHMPPS